MSITQDSASERRDLETKRANRRYALLLLPLFVLASVALFFPVYYRINLQSLERASFEANNFNFVNNGGIQTTADVTSNSRFSLIQVNADIDGHFDGICGYGFASNRTVACVFTSQGVGNLVSCAQLPKQQNHTLSLSAYFANTNYITNTYTVTSSELGC
jgi:hypothetical protein